MSDALPRGVVPYAPVAPSKLVGESELMYENHCIEDISNRMATMIDKKQLPMLEKWVTALLADPPTSEQEYQARSIKLRKQFKFVAKKSQILQVYLQMVKEGRAVMNERVKQCLVTKAAKSQSGVLVITVLTSPTPAVEGKAPQNFSCKWDCHYCPNQPGQPRSYLRDEPAVRRANQNQFDPVLQFADRLSVLTMNGHPADKVELLVLGGTWHSYPLDYQETFVRDLFYAANTASSPSRPRKSLEEEQKENENASCKIIGLTLETRPDCINEHELRRLRRYGCTRVQLGMQHTDDGVLKLVNRGHDVSDAIEALRLLKDSCYKIDIHLMPNLPGSSPDLDRAMFDRMLTDEDLQADQWKIYPCEVVPWTKIEEWYRDGSYKPYEEEILAQVISELKARIHPWIRLNRIIRDIPTHYINGGLQTTHLRETILAKMRARGQRCRCIRCREVGDIGGWEIGAQAAGAGKRLGNREGIAAAERSRRLARQAVLTTRHYKGSGGDEYFISYEAPGDALCGFCRLRLSQRKYYPKGLFPELVDTALIRELHVYGQLIATDDKKDKKDSQHVGFGANMMAEAEHIAYENGFKRMAVISGIGTRGYYRKLGYEVEGEGGFMIKDFRRTKMLPRPPKGRLYGVGTTTVAKLLDLRWKILAMLVIAAVVQELYFKLVPFYLTL
eukprot:TRINITY_DN22419_c0_g1_i2.p1 TRINITY_DN22419_c0_g1~~TRINITY_DN22419_c0_g1_i2.p1  ORF type:complete len:685 (+),score=181.87 TRINITY_DN22419_c0_g1_i2:38-2056(+)